jgi:glyoxalase family protein
MTTGIHHISVMSSNAQNIYDFYAKILGLRFVKKTVNFDAPDVYHLYFGDEKGNPGTALTFFIFPTSGTGLRGVGQITKISFEVPMESLGFWIERFNQQGVKHKQIEKFMGESVLKFYDPDGLQLELVMTSTKKKTWTNIIDKEFAIKSFHSVELSVDDYKKTEELIVNVLGYKLVKSENNHHIYENESAEFAKYLDLFSMPNWPEGRPGAGTVHHVAFRAKDDETELKIREKVTELGLQPTQVIDRNYFHSVYFREPNEILFEIATDKPGFLIDEDIDKLGSSLKLPPQYEHARERIKGFLPPLHTNEEIEESAEEVSEEFNYKFIEADSDDTLILFHGTGGDELQMIDFASELGFEGKILSIRGGVQEDGLNRYFRRFGMGQYDLDNYEEETIKLAEFLYKIADKHKFELEKAIFLGYSNGANILQNLIIRYAFVKKAFLLHPSIIYRPDFETTSDAEILITTGESDEYLTKEDLKYLEELFTKSGAKVESFIQKGGHEITVEEINFIKNNLMFKF